MQAINQGAMEGEMDATRDESMEGVMDATSDRLKERWMDASDVLSCEQLKERWIVQAIDQGNGRRDGYFKR